MIKDSGERREFETGAVRDIQDGKGRFDLMPLGIIAASLYDAHIACINSYMEKGDTYYLYKTIESFISENYPDKETAMLELAIHYEEGAKKYGEGNWKLGINLHSYIDSAVRHYMKHKRGDTDERHDRAFLWNLFTCIWTHENKPELIDLPFKDKE